MIQRIQTVYLLLIVIITSIMMFGNLKISSGIGMGAKESETIVNPSEKITYDIFMNKTVFDLHNKSSMFENKNNLITYSLLITMLMSFVSIFLFKNLPLQLRLVMFNTLFIGLVNFYIFYQKFKVTNLFQSTLDSQTHLGFFIGISLFLFNYFAFRGIKKDIKLLASVDRLR